MTPTAPSGLPAATGSAPQAAAPRMSPTGAEPPAAPRPELARAAVTQAEATAKAALGVPGAGRPVPEIPPDPPPVKGLGIPPLDTARVGDFDRREPAPPPPEAPPPAMSDLLQALQDRAPPGLDRKA
ncbi:hypothetical protein N8I71_13165 [Roseibacterium sp. SDUM158016]|uniref:hypothetical protein n=1 Tax=Roseicyclus sediminis TaxID=2980997 RepID=UPI0021CE4C5E|nr:hypothetical protein [Roseibacterium sp. SDUM158016]MCU4653788.1 hypothetical protein [Roseibacterium sp. SDUM158016]